MEIIMTTDNTHCGGSDEDLVVYTLASGSSGNAVYIRSGEVELLIDAGISKKRIECAMNSVGSTLSNITAIFITHEHSDHISSLDMITKHHKIPIYLTSPSAEAILGQPRFIHAAECARPQSIQFDISLGRLNIRSFPTPHDSAASVGYVVTTPDSSAAVATDIGHITSDIESALYGVKNVILESNHDVNMLLSGPYSYPLKCRILSDYGHLSNEAASIFAASLCEHGTSRLLLAHLSRENNFPELAIETTRPLLPPNVSLSVAAPDAVVRLC